MRGVAPPSKRELEHNLAKRLFIPAGGRPGKAQAQKRYNRKGTKAATSLVDGDDTPKVTKLAKGKKGKEAAPADKAPADASAPEAKTSKKEKKEKEKKPTEAAEGGKKKEKAAGGGKAAAEEASGEPVPSMIDLRVGHIVDSEFCACNVRSSSDILMDWLSQATPGRRWFVRRGEQPIYRVYK